MNKIPLREGHYGEADDSRQTIAIDRSGRLMDRETHRPSIRREFRRMGRPVDRRQNGNLRIRAE